jgi:PAS domain S-box-containing protein
MSRSRHKFESEVHLGLLLIVFLLLLLNFVSNYVLFRARNSAADDVISSFQSAALGVTRVVQDRNLVQLADSLESQFRIQYRLSGVLLIPSHPSDDSREARVQWFSAIAAHMPPGRIPSVAEKLLQPDFQKLQRGSGDEYFFVDPIPMAGGRNLLILSVNEPELAYLDNSLKLLRMFGIGALVVVGLAYLFLSRVIFAPFRRIRQEAYRAGRTVGGSDTDAEGVVTEYRTMIEELKAKESELLRLNAEIQNRAESLEEFNRYLLLSVDTGVITLDTEGVVLTVNNAAGVIFGTGPDSLIGLTFDRAFSASFHLIQAVAEHLAGGAPSGYKELSLTVGGSSERIVGVTISPIRDHSEGVVGTSILLNDLTELTRLRGEIEKSRRLSALGEMAGGLAHQLRNSIGAISGFASLAKKKLSRAGESVEAVASLLGEAGEAENLISRFLSFARPMHFCPVATDLDDFIKHIVSGFSSREDLRHITFKCRFGSCGSSEVDPLLLKQAVANLIDNAVNAYDGLPGDVLITSSVDRGNLRVEIADHGSGISPDALEKIFTPFYSSRPSGTGLGLPLASRLIDLHGGTISVRSEPSQGTVFTITLPRRQAATDTRATQVQPEYRA